jgi:MFS-type transporter involved in bile tolerance (Atg22 family)
MEQTDQMMTYIKLYAISIILLLILTKLLGKIDRPHNYKKKNTSLYMSILIRWTLIIIIIDNNYHIHTTFATK